MKKLMALVLGVVMMLSMAACGTEKADLEYVKDKGTLVVGITDFAPMDYKEDGEWIGFDADMAKALGTALALEAGPAAQILCIDGIHAHRQSYLDIGAPVGPALTVVVKTLIFEK